MSIPNKTTNSGTQGEMEPLELARSAKWMDMEFQSFAGRLAGAPQCLTLTPIPYALGVDCPQRALIPFSAS
jgi:hypothetical protein